MGKVVKAVTKPFKSVLRTIGSAVGVPSQFRQLAQQATAAPPPAAAQPSVIPQGEADSTSGESSERTKRKGKRSLTIRRTNVGGGSGLNV